MSEEIAQAAGDLAYWQRRAEQAERARDAERAARRNAEADVGWWRATVANYVTSATVEDRQILRMTMAEALTRLHPGAALLVELAAARAFIREIRGAMLIGGWRDEQSALLAAYDKVTKARDE